MNINEYITMRLQKNHRSRLIRLRELGAPPKIIQNEVTWSEMIPTISGEPELQKRTVRSVQEKKGRRGKIYLVIQTESGPVHSSLTAQ